MRRPPLLLFCAVASSILGLGPWLCLLLYAIATSQFRCATGDGGFAATCDIGGGVMAELLNWLMLGGWMAMLTFPLLAVGPVLWVIWGVRRRRARRAPAGADAAAGDV